MKKRKINRSSSRKLSRFERRLIKGINRFAIPSVGVVVLASCLSSVVQAHKEASVSADTVTAQDMITFEVHDIDLLGGASAEAEFLTFVQTEDETIADEVLPVAGAADETIYKDEQIVQVPSVSENVTEEIPEEVYEEDPQFGGERAEEEVVNEYENFAVANVSYDFVNVRSGAGVNYEIVGKMYDGSVAEIIEECEEADGLWFHVTSGSVEGYIKADYFIYGDGVEDAIEENILRYANVRVNILNVRDEADIDGDRLGYLTAGEKVLILDEEDGWYKVKYTDEKEGYICADYVGIEEEFISAKSIEEEKKELEEKKKNEDREKQQAQAQTAVVEDVTFAVSAPAENYSSNPELRQAIVNYAMQYVGNRYVPAGQSLAGGTDCSGFTCYVYRDFGYSLSRTPLGQMQTSGRSISLDQAQPGDIICYSYGGGCMHVALYIGNGQIVHEANSRMGCVVSSIDFMPIVAVKNVID
ncbi:MAG: SH3 domain-containing protein [Lachnospiraceae bacterium]|nr:SH3 domain-containing protein [Lachnospiraceae bacterium]